MIGAAKIACLFVLESLTVLVHCMCAAQYQLETWDVEGDEMECVCVFARLYASAKNRQIQTRMCMYILVQYNLQCRNHVEQHEKH
jgi:hypothetical protein